MNIEAFYKASFDEKVKRLAMSRMLNFQDAEDIVQDAFIELMEFAKRAEIRDLNAVVDVLIRRAVWRHVRNIKDAVTRPEETPISSVEIDAEHVEILELLDEIRRSYNDVHAQAIYLHLWRGYTARETAEILGIGISQVTTVCSRFRKHVREELNVDLGS